MAFDFANFVAGLSVGILISIIFFGVRERFKKVEIAKKELFPEVKSQKKGYGKNYGITESDEVKEKSKDYTEEQFNEDIANDEGILKEEDNEIQPSN